MYRLFVINILTFHAISQKKKVSQSIEMEITTFGNVTSVLSLIL